MILHRLYNSPIRIYMAFFLLGLLGLFCYFRLPVALFPNSTRPEVGIEIPYGSLTREGFLSTYGKDLEGRLHRIQSDHCVTDLVEGEYYRSSAEYHIRFSWGNRGAECLKEVQQILMPIKSQFPEDVQNRTYTYPDSRGTGFFLANFYSATRSDVDLYKALEPLLRSKLAAIEEADQCVLVNPSQEQITLEISAERLASLKMTPKEVIEKIQSELPHYNAGLLKYAGEKLSIDIGTPIQNGEDLEKLVLGKTPGKMLFLGEVATIRREPSSKEQRLTLLNGVSSVFIHAKPASGKNIRDMSEKIRTLMKESLQSDPKLSDIRYEVVVDPGLYVDQSIRGVLIDVGICSLLAVLILFFFIGTMAGTLPALIEIPLSLLLSFILMKWMNVQINLVSLGGLALSIGMNVDASIVVIDAILKRFSLLREGDKTKSVIVSAVVEAVHEVWVPVVLSTLTSLIVFIPLAFTSDLTEAILGDLAKAVIFSHGLSLFIALLLVPSIRVHMATHWGVTQNQHVFPRLDRGLQRMYDAYVTSLSWFLRHKKLQWALYGGVIFALIAVLMIIPTKLKREIIGVPETSIISMDIKSYHSTDFIETRDYILDFERKLKARFPSQLAFTFLQVYQKDQAQLWVGLKDTSLGKQILEDLEEMTKPILDAQFNFYPWNPAELPIPNPPDWEISFHGKELEATLAMRDSFRLALLESRLLERWNPDFPAAFPTQLSLLPIPGRWSQLHSQPGGLAPSDMGQLITLSVDSLAVGKIDTKEEEIPIVAMYRHADFQSPEDLGNLPVPVGKKVIPLRTLFTSQYTNELQTLTRLDGEPAVSFSANFTEKEKKHLPTLQTTFQTFLKKFQQENPSPIQIVWEDTQKETTKALEELVFAVCISLVLIFLVLYLQFSSFIHTLIIMLAIPLGLIGVFLSLYVFNSTLSVNAALGIILLIGITVANSIMLVEKILHMKETGAKAREAILTTARQRVRPILMTSLTTILGMLPLALGTGEGGKILQPLGIAVCGGLWVSLLFTLYLVPALEYAYLKQSEFSQDR